MAGGGHDHAGHVLVAAGDGDVGVVVLSAGYGFDGVGDDFTSLEREAHSCGLLGESSCRQWGGVCDIPSPPIVIASDTPIVLNCHASMSCLITDALTTFPKSCTGEKLC